MVHPVAALKVKAIAKKIQPIYKSNFNNPLLDTFSNGGKLDAYRHLLYMAAFTQKVKAKKISKLGIAHEKGNYLDFLNGRNEDGERPDSLSCVMDLLNNEVAIEFSRNNKIKSADSLSDLCISWITTEKATFMKRDTRGNYLTCDGTVIKISDYKGVWFIPKCLVKK